jgi:hypothetical protein
MYELALTISGLALVTIDGIKGDSNANGAAVEIPPEEGHRTLLTFRRPDLMPNDDLIEGMGRQGRTFERFFGPDGTDILAFPLENGEGRFLLPAQTEDSPQMITMRWLSPASAFLPTPDTLMDWLVTTDDLGIKLEGVEIKPLVRVLLPGGTMRSKNVYRDERGNPALYKSHPTRRQHACSDDIEVITSVGVQGSADHDNYPVRFLWQDRKGEITLRFRPEQEQRLSLCLANDDILVTPGFPSRSVNRHQLADLELLVERFEIGQRAVLPEFRSGENTNGQSCPQAIRFLQGSGQ